MEEVNFKGRAIYTTKGAAREYGRVGCNFYKGCPNECEYCYLKIGPPSKQLGGNTACLKKCFKDEDDALRIFRKEVHTRLDTLKKTGVFLSFATDPMITETRSLTLKAATLLSQMKVPVRILTKCADWIHDDDVVSCLCNISALGYLDLGFTLTGRDDMEPNANSNLERILAMRELHGKHFRTWASIEPVIDWNHARMVIEMSLPCCDHYKIGLRSGVKKDYYDLLQSGMRLDELTKTITEAGRTVYLKESARRLLRRCYKEEYYNKILSRTVDMDGKYIKNEKDYGKME